MTAEPIVVARAGDGLAAHFPEVNLAVAVGFVSGPPLARLPVDGLRTGLRYDGADAAVLAGLVAGGHGLAVLPAPPAAAHPGLAGVPIGAPRLVHRVELLRLPAAVPESPRSLRACCFWSPWLRRRSQGSFRTPPQPRPLSW